MSKAEIRPYQITMKPEHGSTSYVIFTSDPAAELFVLSADAETRPYILKCQGMMVFACDINAILCVIDMKSNMLQDAVFKKFMELETKPKMELMS